MSRILKCDVCDSDFPYDAFLATVEIPQGWVEDDSITLDVCSPKCLLLMAQALSPEQSVEKETKAEETGPVKQLGDTLTARRSQFRTLTPEESSEATGVRIKGRGN